MPTVNFQCGQCKKMMAVDGAYLGKAVRCPHCKVVVTAPAQPPAPVSAGPPSSGSSTTATIPAKDDQESIFGEHIDEDLFGGTQKPVVYMPPSPPPPPATGNAGLEATVFQVPGGNNITAQPPAYAAPAGSDQAARRPGPNNNLLVLSALIILVPYALFMTAIAIYLYFSQASQPHPFEMLPDDGEPKSTRQGSSSRSKKRVPATDPLPPQLIVPLGQSLTVGDLQITPQSIDQKNLVFRYRTGRFTPQPSQEQALVMNLELKNLSKNVWFRPTDPLFDHQWKQNKDPMNVLPYTHLEVNGVRYCSPIPFNRFSARVKQHGDNLLEEYVEGQDDDKRILGPGDVLKTIIFTDPKDQVPAALPSHPGGKLIWRVQLRRGFVKYKDVEWSRTVVFGVEFDKSQIVSK